jgi:hypothetical protein
MGPSAHRRGGGEPRRVTADHVAAADRRSAPRLRFALAAWGIRMPPAVGAILMSISTIVVALNAQLLRRVDLDIERS